MQRLQSALTVVETQRSELEQELVKSRHVISQHESLLATQSTRLAELEAANKKLQDEMDAKMAATEDTRMLSLELERERGRMAGM